MSYQKLSPTQLREAGLSPKSERYVDTRTGELISKRQYQKARGIGQYTGREATPKGQRSKPVAPTPGGQPPRQKDIRKVRAGRASGEAKRLRKLTGDPESYKLLRDIKNMKPGIERSKKIAQLFEKAPKDQWAILRKLLGS